jgi:anti-sigma factor RsiW
MMHAPAHILLEYADGELPRKDREQVMQHLRACADCETALAELRATRTSLTSLLAQVDEAEPEAWPKSVAAIYTPPVRSVGFTYPRPVAWRWAAGIVLFSGVAVAGTAMLRSGAPVVPESEAVRAPAVAAAPAAPGGGVFVDAVNGAATIDIADAAVGTRVAVQFTNAAQIGLFSYGEFTPAFVAQRGRVLVRMTNRSAQLRLQVPATLPVVRIVADGVPVAIIESGRLRVLETSTPIRLQAEER